MPQNVTIVGTITIGEDTKMCSISGVGAIVPVDPGYGVPNVPKPPIDPGLHPEHPIYNPPGIWPSPGHPAHPIVLPPDGPPIEPPSNPPNANWEWGWSPAHGWHPVYVPGDKPRPPGK